MLLECQNCGAPLEAKGTERVVKCTYCGRANQMAAMRTMAQQTPAGWRPPPVWTPPAHFPAPSQPINYHRQAAGGIAAVAMIPVILSVVGVAVAGVVAFAASRPSSSSGTSIQFGNAKPAPAVDKAAAWDGKQPLECALNEKLVVENKTVKLNDTVINASTNCKLEIRNCTLEGLTVIAAGTNAEVKIVNSTLIGEQFAVKGGINLKLRVQENSKLSSGEIGIKAPSNAEIRIDDSAVEAEEVAIAMTVNGKVWSKASRIVGKEKSFDAGMNAEIRIDEQSTVEGKKSLGPNSKIHD